MERLRDGSLTADVRADALRDDDPRSAEWPATALPAVASEARPRSREWHLDIALDQGLSGGCVGFAFAHWLAAEPALQPDINAQFARDVIYYGAQKIDRWPGGEYPGAVPIASGTSVLAAAKTLHRLGLIVHYHWGTSISDLSLAVSHTGPVVLGVDWYQGMKRPNSKHIMAPTGARIGRHCLLVLGIEAAFDGEAVDAERSFFRVQNSQGTEWADGSRALIRNADLEPLLENAEICIPTPAPTTDERARALARL